MLVRIICPDGDAVDGTITSHRGRSLLATVPGIAGYVEFRLILGDWISEDGHTISIDFCEQQAGTRAILSWIAKTTANR